MTQRHVDVLLVGGGVAAVRCARTLRRRGHTGSILLVGDEPTPPYNRPPLSKELLRDDLPDELVAAEPEAWYARHSVELRVGERVAKLDPEARTAELGDGSRISFDHCLLATGAEPRRPRVKGAERSLLLRTLADARGIRRRALEAGRGARAVLIGGGFIGVEVSASLASLGLQVVMVEVSEQPWGGSLGAAIGAWAVETLTAAGVDVRLGAGVSRLGEREVWIGEERMDADLVVAGVGVTPRTELAEAAGLACDDGVLVDAAYRTSSPAVLAAGDVARVPHPMDASGRGLRVEHWHAAREAGEASALAVLGQQPANWRAPWVFSEFAGATLDVVGSAPGWEEERLLGDPRSGRFVVAYVAEDRVLQLAIVNAGIEIADARSFVEEMPRAAELRRLPMGTGGA